MDQAGHKHGWAQLQGLPGDSCALLAFDLDQHYADDLAAFAVQYTGPDGQTHPALNRLSFDRAVTAKTRLPDCAGRRPPQRRYRNSTGVTFRS